MDNIIQRFGSGAAWEEIVGYSRAVRFGPFVEVSGTVAWENDHVIGPGDPFRQTDYILDKISKSLEKAGARMEDVVRTRIFVTNIGDWEEIGKAHGKWFADVRPCATMLEVSQLIHPDLLVEIEVSAVIPANLYIEGIV